MSKEIWKDIPNYKGLYQASTLGRIKSLKTGELRKFNLNGKYYRVCLSKNSKMKNPRVHQLIAITFLGHKPNGNNITVDHINGITTDNRLSNLQLLSERQNKIKSVLRKKHNLPTGVNLQKNGRYCANIYSKGTRFYLGDYDTPEEASKAYQYKLKQTENEQRN